MTIKNKILEILKSNSQKSVIGWAVEEEDFELVADELVKGFKEFSDEGAILAERRNLIKKKDRTEEDERRLDALNGQLAQIPVSDTPEMQEVYDFLKKTAIEVEQYYKDRDAEKEEQDSTVYGEGA